MPQSFRAVGHISKLIPNAKGLRRVIGKVNLEILWLQVINTKIFYLL
jgi:hypothetical protein